MVTALLATGKHTITALRHSSSSGTLPSGVHSVDVDYDDEASVVSALKGQHFLIITLSVRAPKTLHSTIVRAAAAAGIKYIMPNIYGFDTIGKPQLASDTMFPVQDTLDEITQLGMNYIVMTCGFWYEWSLGLGEQWFGFTIKERKVTFFDDGEAKINASTWLLCGEAIAALLSLPVGYESKVGGARSEPLLQDWKNACLYFSSFYVSQRDMLDSVHRVLGTTDADWDITHEATEKRYRDGQEELKNGIMTGFAKLMYSRVFLPNGDGEFEAKKQNELLRLSWEELDVATRRTVEMVDGGWNPLAGRG